MYSESISEYRGEGYPFVFVDGTKVAELKALFNDRAEWTSAELNERLGWQFSQAVYGLRQQLRKSFPGLCIVTENLGHRQYRYRLAKSVKGE